MPLNKQAIIDFVESTQLRDDLPEFKSGDNISVHLKIKDGNKTRIQKFEGLVIRVRGSGLGKTFILRKETLGVNSEITFNYANPNVVKIEILRKGKVRRNYLSYIRNLHGKAARIKSATTASSKKKVA
ncbi:MAG: 50S ribosomal protein L19 [Mycoplasmataceae bacterium]|jgi:large subunit ribosomal protein L19|nr:50S ribosomal protein L19 [Mycoplasmataceae bacterium]